MSGSGYLTLEEVAEKLGRPPSWVKARICEGKLGATLAGNRWLISPGSVVELLSDAPPAAQPSSTIHDFLPERRAGKPRGAPNHQKPSKPARVSEAAGRPTKRSKKSSSFNKNDRSEKGRGKRTTLTQRIRELDQEFDRLSVRLKTALLKHREATGSGKKANPPDNLLRQWKTAKAELRYLVAKADAEGLVLPTDLTIHEVLAQEYSSINRSTVAKDSPNHAKPPATIKGIDGYGRGPGGWNSQEDQRLTSGAEARLLILRSRQLAAARSMQDRGKGRQARDAAAADWARTRGEAERLQRGPQAAPDPARRPKTERTPAENRPKPSKATNRAPARPPRAPSSPPPDAPSAPAARAAGKAAVPPREAAGHHQRGIGRVPRRADHAGEPAPLGDSASGVVLVVEEPVGPRVLEALKLSLRAVGLMGAHVTHASKGPLGEELRATAPHTLVAIGAGAARDIDAMGYPLALKPFSSAKAGAWFSWTKETSGLLLPALAPALDDEAAKRRFWRAFLGLKALVPGT